MNIFITGGAGFIGSHLVTRFIQKGNHVTVYDNFSNGKKSFLQNVITNKRLTIIKGDVLQLQKLIKTMKGADFVYHFSANADVQKGSKKTDLDLKQGTIATHNILEAMRKNGIKKIVFPSSMTVYGKQQGLVSETEICLPISLYGASKVAGESLVNAYSSMFGIQSFIFRFANVIGAHATHGVIYDHIKKLIKNPTKLEVFGNGNQEKPYMYIQDIIDAMMFVVQNANETINLFNIGSDGTITVKEIDRIILTAMSLKNVKFIYTGNAEGWVGDVPKFKLNSNKLKKLGFVPRYSSTKAVSLAVSDILKELTMNERKIS